MSFADKTSTKCSTINGNTRTGISLSDTQIEPFSATANLLSKTKRSKFSKSCGLCKESKSIVLKDCVLSKLENFTFESGNIFSI